MSKDPTYGLYAIAWAGGVVGALWLGVPVATLLILSILLVCAFTMVLIMLGVHEQRKQPRILRPKPFPRMPECMLFPGPDFNYSLVVVEERKAEPPEKPSLAQPPDQEPQEPKPVYDDQAA